MTQEDVAQVMRQFCLFTDLDEQEAERYRAMVEFSAQEIEGRLRRGVDTDLHRERIILLCAANAYYKYVLVTAAAESVKLGDLSVSGGGDREAALAAAVLEEYCGACADILCDRAFLFGQVGG